MTYRSCIGCKTVCDKSELIRIVLEGGEIIVDKDHKRPGRLITQYLKILCLRFRSLLNLTFGFLLVYLGLLNVKN